KQPDFFDGVRGRALEFFIDADGSLSLISNETPRLCRAVKGLLDLLHVHWLVDFHNIAAAGLLSRRDDDLVPAFQPRIAAFVVSTNKTVLRKERKNLRDAKLDTFFDHGFKNRKAWDRQSENDFG